MAGDWVLMRVGIARNPKVISMADRLAGERAFMDWLTDPVRQRCEETAYDHVGRNVTVSVTLAGLIQVWGTVNELGVVRGDDSLLEHSDLFTLDEIAGIPCFGEAMARVGWAVDQGDGSILFPKFLKYNVPAQERRRARDRERQQKRRDRERDGSRDNGVTGHVTTSQKVAPTEQNSTEQKNKNPPTPLTGAPTAPEFVDAWNAVPQFHACKGLAQKRLRHFKARCKDPLWVASWRDALARAARSPFCRGEAEGGWRATVDWFLRSDTVLKLLEGAYDHLRGKPAGPPPRPLPTPEERAELVRRQREKDAREAAQAAKGVKLGGA